MALDPDLKALLTEDVLYEEKIAGLGKNGQESYAAAVTLKCYPMSGARQVQQPDGTLYTSTQVLYFDADDETVQGFKLGDRFTSIGIAGGQTLKAAMIEVTYSPGPLLGEAMT